MIDTMLSRVEQEWERSKMPSASLLASADVSELILCVLDFDVALHQRHLRVVSAMQAEHANCAVFTQGPVQKNAKRYVRTALLAMSRYKELVEHQQKYPNVWLQVRDLHQFLPPPLPHL